MIYHINVLVFLCFSLVPLIYGNLCSICKCGISIYNGENMYVTNCTYSGISSENVSILENLPEETEVLIFKGNDVRILPVNIFGSEKNLTNLKVIDMTDNQIEEIKGKTFHHVPVVERLILDHNSITLTKNSHPRVFSNFENLKELHLTDAFLDYNSADLAEELHNIFINSNLTQLIKLHLEQNEIKSFADKRVFCDLKNLMDLHLGDNDLDNLNFHIKCLPRLRYLDLQRNKITHFTGEELSTFDSLTNDKRNFEINIHGNPFVCDCNAYHLYQWFKKTKVTFQDGDDIKCHYFKNSSHEITLKDFSSPECSVSTGRRYDGVHPYTKYLLFSLIVFLAIYLTYLSVKYSYVYCRHNVVPPSKVHYVVIKNQDDNREVHVQLNKIAFQV